MSSAAGAPSAWAAPRIATLPYGRSTSAFPDNRAFFRAPKDLQRPVGQVDAAVAAIDAHTLEVRLAAKSYAHFVHLVLPLEDTTYGDNYFDLLPGEERVIAVRNSKKAISPEMLTVRWR